MSSLHDKWEGLGVGGKRSCKGLWAEALGERRDVQTLESVLSGCVKGDRQKRQRETYIWGEASQETGSEGQTRRQRRMGVRGRQRKMGWTDTEKEDRETGRGRC